MPKSTMPKSWLVILLLLPFGDVAADTLMVPMDYETIQEAIDEAEDGDVVHVAPGTYEENIDFLGKSITVEAGDGPKQTTIDGGQDGAVVVFDSGEDQDAVLCGFTITNGTGIDDLGARFGGGIYIGEASPEIRDCVICDNSVEATVCGGGGIAVLAGDPLIIGCRIENNCADGSFFGPGGGILIAGSSGTPPEDAEVTIEDCVITANESPFGGGVASSINTTTTILRTVVAANIADEAAGVSLAGGGSLTFCTIYGNVAEDGTGGLRIDSRVPVRNCIIWENSEPQIFEDFDGDLTYCDWEGLPDEFDDYGNFNADPELASPDFGDFQLTEDSPCIDAGDPDDPDDSDGTVADVGAIAFFQQPEFLRGDINGNGTTSALIDALYLLSWAFESQPEPPCYDAADVDDNGTVSALLDSLALLFWAFDNGAAPPDPGPYACGPDATSEDDLSCTTEPEDCR